MRATKSSSRSPISNEIAGYGLAFLVLSAIGVAAALYFYSHGYLLYYGDAEAHLNIARRLVDTRTPGFEQIGSPWLPLPHFLMLPFVGSIRLWQTGLAGTIPGITCFLLAGMMLFGTARLAFQSTAASLTALLVFALNPNLLYLASAPMTEPVYFAGLLGLLFCSTLFARNLSLWAVGAAGLFSCAASLTRYDGWFLIPFVTLFFLIVGGRRRWTAAVLFGAIASTVPVYWLGHNLLIYGDPLEFYRGPNSAKAIQRGLPYPGEHGLAKAWLYFRTAAELTANIAVVFVGSLGCLAAIAKKAWWPVLFFLIGPLFYLLSMYTGGGQVIYVPTLWPQSYYNSRYGLNALPLLAFGAGALVSLKPQPWLATVVVSACLIPWLLKPSPENWVCWKESQVNSEDRRAWTHRAAEYLKLHYRKGDGIIANFGDLTGVLREAGIPLKECVHSGNNPEFDATIARPDLFLHHRWALAQAGDSVATAVQKIGRTAPAYDRVQAISVGNAQVIEIYRRPLAKLP